MNFFLMSKQRKLLLIAAILGIIAVFLPWITVSASAFGVAISQQNKNGFHGMGIVVFLAFSGAAIATLVGDQRQPLEKTSWIAAMGAGVIALLFTIIVLASSTGDMSGGMGLVKAGIGIGIWVALAASLGILAVAWLLKAPGESIKSGLESLKKSIAIPTAATADHHYNSFASTDKMAELERLIKLKEAGAISEDEYQQLKEKLLR